jgi:hypothetical protein
MEPGGERKISSAIAALLRSFPIYLLTNRYCLELKRPPETLPGSAFENQVCESEVPKAQAGMGESAPLCAARLAGGTPFPYQISIETCFV